MTNFDKSYFISTFWTISFSKKYGEKIYSTNTFSGENPKYIMLNYASDNNCKNKKDWLIRINLDDLRVKRNISHPSYNKLKDKLEKFLVDISFYFV